jgi:hypothetical protein
VRLALLLCAAAQADPAYVVEDLPVPSGVVAEIGGVDFAPDGRLVACTRRGDVWTIDVESGKWTRFASGLHEPLGVVAGAPGEVFAADRASLVRLVDRDGDGAADAHESLSEAWGLSGNYHEYAFGPVRDARGDFYVGLGCGSDLKGVFDVTRGVVSPLGRRGRMFSAVPYRGWIVKVARDGGAMTPFAKGLREPFGLRFSPAGDLFASDNQGDWVGTSCLHHVRENGFHGHPSSLAWDPAFAGRDPLAIPVEELLALRLPPAILFPHGTLCNSPGQPIWDESGGLFGPFAGQAVLGSLTDEAILRVALEKVGGEWQGAVLRFLEGGGLRRGCGRLAFSPEGRTLYVGQTLRGWGSGEGLQRVRWTGRTPFEIATVSLTARGFDLALTEPAEPRSASAAESYSVRRFRYHYWRPYGSPEIDSAPVRVASAAASGDGRTVVLVLDEPPRAGFVYELRASGVASRASGAPLAHPEAWYTVNRVRE